MKKKEIIKQLVREIEDLHKEIETLIEHPDSPEAAVLRTRWEFTKEIRKQMDTGEPVDANRLYGLVGKMLYPEQKRRAKDDNG